MGLLDEAVSVAQATGDTVDIAAVRRYRGLLGGSLNLSNKLAGELGLFARVGKRSATSNPMSSPISTDTVSGAVAQGIAVESSRRYGPMATVINNISGSRERYLNAGGLWDLVGDGKLPHAGPENLWRPTMTCPFFGYIQLTVDDQWVDNPASIRLCAHVQF